MSSDIIIKIFSLTSVAFLLSIAVTPLLSHFLYKFKFGKNIRSDGSTPLYTQMHKAKQGTPTMGGVLVWGMTAFLAVVFWAIDRVFNINEVHILNFLTRRETLLPLGAMAGAAIVGLADDFLDIRGLGHKGRGFRFRFKVFLYAAVASIGAWWFYFKLGFDSIHIPFLGDFVIGMWFIPFFIAVVVGTSFAVNQTDGLDGLAGGVLLMALSAYMVIAIVEGKYNLATMLGVVNGSMLAFLWFNVFPARFFMGDTGSMGIGVLLAVVAFITNQVLLLPIIGFIFVLEAASYFIQIGSKSILKKKFFLSAPIHHHLEASGWPESKVTMRFWILAAVSSIIGLVVFFIDK